MKQQRHPPRQDGVALITAILVVALAATLAVSMTSRQQFAVRRSENLQAAEQGMLYQRGIEGWVAQILRRDRKENDTDGPADLWATQLPPLPVEGGMLAGQVADLQGLFNLNTLWHDGKVDTLALERFKRLMMVAGVEGFTASSVVDWIDSDIDPTLPDGAEDGTYLGMQPAHRSANRPMVSRSELLAMAGMSRDDYQRLAPFVTALPTATTININTAPKEVLRALADGISDSDAAALITGRDKAGYKSVQDFLQQDVLAGRGVVAAGLSVTSSFFLLNTRLRIGVVENGYSALLYRRSNGEAVVVQRAQGEL